MNQQQNIDFVLRTVEQRDIRFVRLWFVDVLGRLKSFAISPEDLEVAFEEGVGFDGSAIEGFATPEEADMLAFPDPSTFQVLPWRPSDNGVARVFCDICTPDRKPFAGDPRECLRATSFNLIGSPLSLVARSSINFIAYLPLVDILIFIPPAL